MKVLQVGLVDDDSITRTGIATVLQQNKSLPLDVYPAASIEVLAPKLSQLDILLLDVSQQSPTRVCSTIDALLRREPTLKLIVLSRHLSVKLVQGSIKSGAVGFMYKDGNLDYDLIAGITAVNRGLIYQSPKVSDVLFSHYQAITQGSVSQRELDVLRLTATGLTVGEIAVRLKVSGRSIYRARERLREVLGVPTNEMLIKAAQEHGLLDPGED